MVFCWCRTFGYLVEENGWMYVHMKSSASSRQTQLSLRPHKVVPDRWRRRHLPASGASFPERPPGCRSRSSSPRTGVCGWEGGSSCCWCRWQQSSWHLRWVDPPYPLPSPAAGWWGHGRCFGRWGRTKRRGSQSWCSASSCWWRHAHNVNNTTTTL